jgi:hypothetical protein
LKNECQDIVEELATARVKEETTHSWNVRDVGAGATLGSFACTDRKIRKVVCPRLLRTSRLKEGAI